jgi:diguanylate cyclase (GGDEF)-like protein
MKPRYFEKYRIEKMLEFLEKQPRRRLLFSAILLLILISILDYLTGLEIMFSFFYLIPIAFGVWLLGRKEGIFLSVTGALTWTLVNQLLREQTSNLFVSYWNAATLLAFFMLVTFLVSEVRLLLEKERALARTDFLTGVLNRRAFYETAKYEIARTKRTRLPFTLIYIDIDAFKAINDTQGHSVGDSLLQLVTETITGNIRACDRLGRLGGDEFAILLPGANQHVAKSIAPRLKRTLMSKMVEKGYPVTFSLGVLTLLTPPENVEVMLKLADEMLYQVKNAGKNAIEYAEFMG